MMTTSHLFEPIQIGNLSLRNRIAMAPMTRSFSPGNVPNDLNVAYYERRAQNDVGLIITEGTCIGHPGANGYPNVPYFYGEEALAGWKRVADAVHAAGGAIFPQLWHVGAVRRDNREPDPEIPAYSPSGIYKQNRPNGVAMTEQDIEDVVNAFADAAGAAQTLGFDGVELHGAHGYLIDQFFWEGTNLRSDQYGGNMLDRTRFAVEVIAAVRAKVGPDFPIAIRFSQWKMQSYEAKLAQDPNMLAAFLEPMVEAGIDIFHCSTRRFWEPEFERSPLNLAGWTKKLSGKPTITVGSVGLNVSFVDEGKRGMADQSGLDLSKIEELDRRIADGEFDMVAVGRALLQNPDWVVKVKAGKYDELESYSQESLKQLV